MTGTIALSLYRNEGVIALQSVGLELPVAVVYEDIER